jgi:hypothetical protein
MIKNFFICVFLLIDVIIILNDRLVIVIQVFQIILLYFDGLC